MNDYGRCTAWDNLAVRSTERYTVHGQSTNCPDGYARTLHYLWDNDTKKIIETASDADREIIEARAILLNAGRL